MCYPDNCIKGIPNNEYLLKIDSDVVIAPHLFDFGKEARRDGWVEESINWEDDSFAIEFTLNQKKGNGQRQFKTGCALISRVEIDAIKNRAIWKERLAYERQPLDDNKYHGNVLLKSQHNRTVRRMLGSLLAMAVSRIEHVGLEE